MAAPLDLSGETNLLRPRLRGSTGSKMKKGEAAGKIRERRGGPKFGEKP